MSDLKPIPCGHCGGEATAHQPEFGDRGDEHLTTVMCDECFLCIERPTYHEAIAAWNRRSPVTPIPVSEPPGDEDIVLAADLRIDRPDEEEWLSWEYENAPCTGEFFKKHYAPKEWVTHYLLLRKGE